jgi:hypothetical protein
MRILLGEARDPQQPFSDDLVLPRGVELGSNDGQSFDREDALDVEPGVSELVFQLLGEVEIRVRKGRPPVLRRDATSPGGFRLNIAKDVRIEDEPTTERVEKWCVARDRRHRDHRSRTADACRLREGLRAVGAFPEVIERSKDESPVERLVLERKPACICRMDAEPRRFTGPLARELDVERDGLDEIDLIPSLGEPFRIAAGAAPDVGDAAERWKKPAEDLPRPRELEGTSPQARRSGSIRPP